MTIFNCLFFYPKSFSIVFFFCKIWIFHFFSVKTWFQNYFFCQIMIFNCFFLWYYDFLFDFFLLSKHIDLPLFFLANYDLQLFLFMCLISIFFCLFSQITIFNSTFLTKIDVQLLCFWQKLILFDNLLLFSVKLRLSIIFFYQNSISNCVFFQITMDFLLFFTYQFFILFLSVESGFSIKNWFSMLFFLANIEFQMPFLSKIDFQCFFF